MLEIIIVKGGFGKMKILDNKLVIIGTFAFLILIIIFLSIFSIYLYNRPIEDISMINNMPKIADADNEETITEKIYVEVKGAVSNPGVYEVSNNNIIDDVVKLAGGLNENAYTDNINFSKKLTDELVIYVYTKEEYKKHASNDENECNTNSYDITDCTKSTVSIITSSSKNASVNNTDLININTASVNDFINLPGIGESKANNIIAYRNENGFFKSIEDLKNVSGIGDATFEQLKTYITV